MNEGGEDIGMCDEAGKNGLRMNLVADMEEG